MNPLKPRFNRSKIPIIPKKKSHEVFVHGTLREKNKVQWSKMSKETFEEMVEKGVLSDEQIIQWEVSQSGGKKDIDLIYTISKLDLGSIEDLKKFKEILVKNPDAIDLVSDAMRIRENRNKNVGS